MMDIKTMTVALGNALDAASLRRFAQDVSGRLVRLAEHLNRVEARSEELARASERARGGGVVVNGKRYVPRVKQFMDGSTETVLCEDAP